MAWRMYDFEVLDGDGLPTGEVFEELVRHDVVRLIASDGTLARRKEVQIIAATPTLWGDSHAHYDAALGQVVSSSKQIDAICKAKGLTPVSDLAPGTAERMIQRQIDHHRHYEKVDRRFDELADKYGMYENIDPSVGVNIKAAERVWAEHCPPSEVAAGTWDGDILFEKF